MMMLAVFVLFILFAVTTLVVVPVMLHPTLSFKRKWLIGVTAFIVIVPGSIALYWWLGVPQMAVVS